jgi:hypothetical protein
MGTGSWNTDVHDQENSKKLPTGCLSKLSGGERVYPSAYDDSQSTDKIVTCPFELVLTEATGS